MLKGLYIMNENTFSMIYGQKEQEEIKKLVDIYEKLQTPEAIKINPGILKEAEVIFTGWGGPLMDKDFLDCAVRLKTVFYGAGSIKSVVTDEFWNRGVRITSAYAANAVPVAEFTLSQILFSLKCGWHFAIEVKLRKKYVPRDFVHGVYGSTVGIISLGMIGARVCEMLKGFDVKVVAYDPYASPELASSLNVSLCSLEEVFQRADVVSLHTPWLKETEGLITGKHIASMKQNAVLINTSRGAVVRENEMLEVLQKRPDLYAVLDVTYPEPPDEGSLLYTLPNVILTPHIAGSMGRECQRMGRYMVDELQRFAAGKPLKWEINRERAAIMA